MLIIIVAVVTQGARTPADMKGSLKGDLVANDGFFQAVGVISFGKSWSKERRSDRTLLTSLYSIRLPYASHQFRCSSSLLTFPSRSQQPLDIWLVEETHAGSLLQGHALFDRDFNGCMLSNGIGRVSHVRR